MVTVSRKAGRPLLLLSPSWGLAGPFVLVIRLGRRRGGKLRSFLSTRDCSQHIPSRGTSQGIRERLCPSWQTLIYLVRIPLRKGHSIQCNVRLAWKSF